MFAGPVTEGSLIRELVGLGVAALLVTVAEAGVIAELDGCSPAVQRRLRAADR